jgi:hypothetical protein
MPQMIDEGSAELTADQTRPESDTSSRNQIVSRVRWFTGTALVAGLICLVCAFAHGDWRYALAATGFILLAGIGGAVLCIDAIICDFKTILAERQEFYRRGQLDGWMKGWRGQEPDVDDPLMH